VKRKFELVMRIAGSLKEEYYLGDAMVREHLPQ